MRRLAAVFTTKRSDKSRSDKSDAGSTAPSESNTSRKPDPPKPKPAKARSAFFRSLSRNGGTPSAELKPKRHPMSPVSTTQAASSSSSSSGGPLTPDDDGASLMPSAANRKTWIPWLTDTTSHPVSSENSVHHSPSKESPRSYISPPTLSLPRASQESTEDDMSLEDSSESESAHPLPNTSLTPVAYFRAATVNSLAPPFSPPPLLHIPGSPIYPRSCNTVQSLGLDESLRSSMFKQRLLHRLQRGDFGRSDDLSLSGFVSKRHRPFQKTSSLGLGDILTKDVNRVGMVGMESPGLKLWANRPCFEDRMVLYIPDEGTGEIKWMRVPGSGFGIAALEFTEGLEALAGLYPLAETFYESSPVLPFSPTSMTPPLSLTPSSTSVSSSMPPSPPLALPALSLSTSSLSSPKPSQPTVTSPTQSRNHSYKAAPSPLRMEHSSPSRGPSNMNPSTITSSSSETSTIRAAAFPSTSTPTITPSASTPTIVFSPTSPSTSPAPHPPKLGVRFAEEEKDDGVPLGYVLRIKQKREEKARFLQTERQRRIHEEERQKYEAERRRQEEERRKWEQERAVWEKERTAMEEERKKRLYAEELASSRARRESQRLGSLGSHGDGMMWEGDREKERERRGREARESYSRPVYDTNAPSHGSRRQTSETLPAAPGSRNGSSPGSSRPPSIVGGGSANGSVRGSSRPPSMYSTPPSSNPDITLRERRESKGSRRGSMVSESSQRPAMDRASFSAYPWNMSPGVPPVPPLPMMPVIPIMPYAMDMPLLPPSPPFMQQYGYRPQPQQRSHSSSPSANHRIPTSYSSDRVNHHGSSSPRHERRSSGDIPDMHRDRYSSSGSPGSRSQSRDRQSVKSQPPPTFRHSSSPAVPRASGTRSSVPPVPTHQPTSRSPAPIPVTNSSRSQPAFQNLSRPTSNRRQTMIS